ncbi:MAG TPA: L,D-transpeptidase family protein [Stellaceae bacterium]|nr:L,D-transpeptidase family protein [Stellaceae bacterium]
MAALLVLFADSQAEANGNAGAATMPAAYHPSPLRADRILVLKAARKLELLRAGMVVKVYPIALGGHPLGGKRATGDGRTPEGVYYIDGRQPQSHYHLALHISYPNAADRAAASALNRDPGGNIMIHGLPNGYEGPLDPVRFYKDWTDGCISVGDRAIEEIAAAVAIGTPIEIRP